MAAPYDGAVSAYLAQGLASARPASANPYPGTMSLYFATDTGVFSVWNTTSVAWVDFATGALTLPVPILYGGTGSTTAATARAALGLAIGIDVQAWDADLDAVAALTTPATTITGALQKAGGTMTGNLIIPNGAAGLGNSSLQFLGNGRGFWYDSTNLKINNAIGACNVSMTIANEGSASLNFGGFTPSLQIQLPNGNAAIGAARFGGTGAPTIVSLSSPAATPGTFSLIGVNNLLGTLLFKGDDGAAYQNAASIVSKVDGTASAGNMPGRITLQTVGATGTTLVDRVSLDSAGILCIGGQFIAVSTPVAGTMVQPLLQCSGSTVGASSLMLNRAVNTAVANPRIQFAKSRGTVAVPLTIAATDVLGELNFAAHNGTVFQESGFLRYVVTAIPGTTYTPGRWAWFLADATGLAAPVEGVGGSNDGSLTMGGVANIVIDGNRFPRPRSTTIAGKIAAANKGNLAHFSDANGGAGAFMRDNGTAYDMVGQRAVKRLTNVDATYTPVADGSRVRDIVGAKTANRKLTLAITNITDGHDVIVCCVGSTGGFTRDVYQADGTTLIASVADGTTAVFFYDATAVLWVKQ